MIPGVLGQAIIDRIKADTGSGGLYQGGAFNIITTVTYGVGTPGAIAYPYIVISRLRLSDDSAMNADAHRGDATLTIFDELVNGLSRIDPIMARLYGNGVTTAGREPTYGFHRHILTVPSNQWNAVGGTVLVENQDIRPSDTNVVMAEMDLALLDAAVATSP